ncbi:hypothetical protein BHM03_00025136 [Ensete ventricosum]|nr:hypothetical protein BHM03_00025136 [Ensete ventricosum]
MFVNGCMNQLLLLQIMAATKFENMVFPTQETPSPTHRRRTGRRERRRAASEGRKNRVSCLKCDIRSAPVDHRRHFWAACKSCHQERISRSSVSSGAGNSYLAGWEVRNDDGPRTSADEGVREPCFFWLDQYRWSAPGALFDVANPATTYATTRGSHQRRGIADATRVATTPEVVVEIPINSINRRNRTPSLIPTIIHPNPPLIIPTLRLLHTTIHTTIHLRLLPLLRFPLSISRSSSSSSSNGFIQRATFSTTTPLFPLFPRLTPNPCCRMPCSRRRRSTTSTLIIPLFPRLTTCRCHLTSIAFRPRRLPPQLTLHHLSR